MGNLTDVNIREPDTFKNDAARRFRCGCVPDCAVNQDRRSVQYGSLSKTISNMVWEKWTGLAGWDARVVKWGGAGLGNLKR